MRLPEDHEYIFICTSLILKPKVWGIREICDFVLCTLSTVHLCTLRRKGKQMVKPTLCRFCRFLNNLLIKNWCNIPLQFVREQSF